MPSAVSSSNDRPSVADAQRDLVRTRILEGAFAAFGELGLSCTMDDIAARAGVGRRTVFRYFSGRDELLAAAAAEWFPGSIEEMPELGERDLEVYLDEVVGRTYAWFERIGVGVGQLVLGTGLSPELTAARETILQRRREVTEKGARTVWRHAGGRGSVPADVRHAFALLVSALGWQALHHNAELPRREAAAFASRCLLLILREQLRAGSRRRS